MSGQETIENGATGGGNPSVPASSSSQEPGSSAPREGRADQGLLLKEVLKSFTVEKFSGDGYDDWAWKMKLYFRQLGVLKVMTGEDKRPEDAALQGVWDERSSAGYYVLSQSLELNQRHHIMHLLDEDACGPMAWALIQGLHAPTSAAASLSLEKQMSALRLSEGEPVQPVLDKMRELYAKLAAAEVKYSEEAKCLKLLSLLPDSWLSFTSGLALPQYRAMWSVEWLRTQVLEEEFRRRQCKIGGDDSAGGFGMQGARGRRGRGDRGAGRGDQPKDNAPASSDRSGAAARGRGGRFTPRGRGGGGRGNRMSGDCWHCKQQGHPWFLCPTKPEGWTPWNRQPGGSGEGHKGGASMVAECNEGDSNGEEKPAGQFFHVGSDVSSAKMGAEMHPLGMWVLDSGAAWTMTPRADLLDAVGAAPIPSVRSTSGHKLTVKGAGRAVVKGSDGNLVVLRDVLLVPDLMANLISLRKLAKEGVSTCTDGPRTFKAQLGSRMLWDLHESKDLHHSMWQVRALPWASAMGRGFQGECFAVGGDGVTVSSRSGETDWMTAHRRLGHIALPMLQQLMKQDAVKGLQLKGAQPHGACETCLLSKFTRFPFHSVAERSSSPLQLVHVDLVGPLPVQGDGGERYFLTIVDDWSRLMWAYPLKQKDHAASTLRDDWLPYVERQTGKLLQRILSDRGGEFIGAEMTAWMKKKGIRRELTTSYTPQSNGVAERANRTILETARALLVESGLGNSKWPHAVRHATVVRNRVLTKVAGDVWVPLERWIGRKPPVDMIRVFGCMAVALIPKHHRSKLGAAATWCVHLGLAVESKGWLLWEPVRNVLFDSRDVKFLEDLMFGSWKKQPESKGAEQFEQITLHFSNPSGGIPADQGEQEDNDEVQEIPAVSNEEDDAILEQEVVQETETDEVLEEHEETPVPTARRRKGALLKGWEAPVMLPGRTRLQTKKAVSFADLLQNSPEEEDSDGDADEDDAADALHISAPTQPASMEDALSGPDRDKWLASRDAEYNSQLENKTWELVHLPAGKKAVQCKWDVRIKTDDKGEISVYKSRLVAKGFQQKEGVDYTEVFAPTAKAPTLRVLLAAAAVCDWTVQQMDVKTAFLYGEIEEEIYMQQPPGYEDGSGRVCKLNKAIYGLKQAPRCWYKKLSTALEEIGFRASCCDESLFLMGEGEQLVLFLVYVDDILLFGSSREEIKKVQQKLMQRFKCKLLGEASYYLGMHVERDADDRWLKLHKEKYIKQLMQKYELEEGTNPATPLPHEFKVKKTAAGDEVDVEQQKHFQSLVGSLLYAAVHTRPDISFAVGQLARVVQNPTQEQVVAAERLVLYLNAHASVGVQYSVAAQARQKGVELLKQQGESFGAAKLFLSCFADASWASEAEDSASVGGYLCVVGGGPVSWRSKKQSETAISTVESEYMALFHAVKEVIWLRRLLEEIGHEQKIPTPLYCDNKGAIAMAKNAVLHGLNKHMRIKWHWVRKEVKRETVQPIYIKTSVQPADFLTKRLAEDPHWRCVRLSGMSMN